jgi:chromosome segregation ATPase
MDSVPIRVIPENTSVLETRRIGRSWLRHDELCIEYEKVLYRFNVVENGHRAKIDRLLEKEATQETSIQKYEAALKASQKELEENQRLEKKATHACVQLEDRNGDLDADCERLQQRLRQCAAKRDALSESRREGLARRHNCMAETNRLNARIQEQLETVRDDNQSVEDILELWSRVEGAFTKVTLALYCCYLLNTP